MLFNFNSLGYGMAKVSVKASEDEKWRVENDLRVLVEAREIQNDPKRFAKVQALAKEKLLEVSAIASENTSR